MSPRQSGWRSLGEWRPRRAGVAQTGPLAHAFITRNPLLPEDYFAPKGGVDDLVLKINKNVDHSLLDCPGKYTVEVAHFTGEVILDQNKIRAIESGAKPGPETAKQGLAAAAKKAHDMTEGLRMIGYEAYEFHDRDKSLVTVGSFDSLGAPGPDGAFKFSPQVNFIIERFGAETVHGSGKTGAIKPKSFIGIFFDVEPIPIEVPKRSISQQLTAGR